MSGRGAASASACARLPCARVDIGHHVVAERRVFGLRRELQTLCGSPARLLKLLHVEIELREKEITVGEVGIHLDRFAVGVELPLAIAKLAIQPAEIEGGLVAVAVQLDFLSVLRDRGPEVAALLGEEREVVVREADVRLRVDGCLDLALRSGQVSALQRNDPERVAGGGELRLEFQRANQLRVRIVDMPVIDQDLRRLVPDLGVLRVELHEAAYPTIASSSLPIAR